MQGVDLGAALGLLVQELRDQGELGDDPIPQAASGDKPAPFIRLWSGPATPETSVRPTGNNASAAYPSDVHPTCV